MGKLNLYKNKTLQHMWDVISGRKLDYDEVEKLLTGEISKQPENIVRKIKRKYRDMARTNIFSFEIDAPPLALQNVEHWKDMENINTDFKFLVSELNLPSKTVSPITISYGGINRSFPNYYTLNERLTVTFFTSKDFFLYKLFNIWLTEMTGRATMREKSVATGLRYLDDISTRARIKVYDLRKREIYMCELIELFPLKISEMKYNVGTEDIQTFSVEFSFRDILLNETDDYFKNELANRDISTLNVFKNTLENIVDRADSLSNILNRF